MSACGFPGPAESGGNLLAGTGLRKEAGDFPAFKSAVTPGVDTVCLYPSVATPAPHGIRMDMEESGYFLDRQHVIHVLAICHILSHLLFD